MTAMHAARLLAGVLCAAALLAACGTPSPPRLSPDRQVWNGPTDSVASHGITYYDRREIAQQVPFPVCITIDDASFKYDGAAPNPDYTPLPPGTFDTGYSLDRWRLVAPAGELAAQDKVYVTVLGSTGIAADYLRLPTGKSC
jgi:hypothetical protein